MKKTKKTAIMAMAATLGVVILYLGSLLDILDISTAMIASVLILFCVVELGKMNGTLVWGATSVLSWLLLPNKTPALFFAFIFGIMPVTKYLFEKLGKIPAWIFKTLLFNAGLLLFGFLAKETLDMPGSIFLTIAYLIALNIVFVLTDILYGRLVRIYFYKYRGRISKYLK